jgi:hypothetical protein
MENIIYKSWNITNAYNEKGVEYWTIWTPDYQDLVSEDFKTISLAKKWIDERVKQTNGRHNERHFILVYFINAI